MRKNLDKIILSVFLPAAIGCGAILPVIHSQNGYVAGFVFLPLFLLICAASLILFVIALIGLIAGNKSAAWILLSAILLPAGFISSGLVAKYFEIGAYYQEPMTPILGGITNVVVFKEGITNDQINDFWNKTMSVERADGRGYDHLPGVRTMGQDKSPTGQETIIFDFFPSATEEQRQFVFSRVKSSPIVYRLLENEPPKEQSASPSPTVKTGEFKEVKTVNSTDSK
jgi:hypothetical protein